MMLRVVLLLAVAIGGGCIGASLRAAPAAAQATFAPNSYLCTDATGNLTTTCANLVIHSPTVIGSERWATDGVSDVWTVGIWPDPNNQSSISFYRGNSELFAMHGANGVFYAGGYWLPVTGPYPLCVSQAGVINVVGGGYC